MAQSTLFDEPAKATPFVPQEHDEAMRSPRPGPESAIVGLFRAMADYAEAHRQRYGSVLSEDYYIGPCWTQLGEGLLGLLNGETGRLDCATLDRQIREFLSGGGDSLSTRTVRELTASPVRQRSTKARPNSEEIGKRRLNERERELLSNIRVDDNFAIYVPQELIGDWALLKAVMVALGGSWCRKTKRRPGGFEFADDVDAHETVRLALETGEIFDARSAEFFETSSALADQMAKWLAPRPGECFLEPSAGKGALVRALRRVCPSVEVTCVEPFQANAEELRNQGLAVEESDFATLSSAASFDGVIMNPPFSKRQDIEHIALAVRHLRHGGRLAAIASAGVLYRNDRLAREFRELVQSHGGTIIENPDGSFAHVGTLVKTVQVRLTKR